MPVPLQYVADTDWNQLRRNMDTISARLDPVTPNVRVFNDAAISHTTSGTIQTLTFNSERWDNGNCHSTAANTSRLTAPITGLYVIGGNIAFAANITGFRQLAIKYNGGNLIASEARPACIGGIETHIAVMTMYRLLAGEYVELQANQNSGGALNIQASANYSPEFFMYRDSGYVNHGVGN